ncbi:MAG: response regulator transcription factor [Phycisphaerae bacterium]|nr:response regulator transcription factor [Phycisphaerae bacterium]
MTHKRTVVVVEDEEAIRRGVADTLRMAGFNVVEAGDGVTGLAESKRGDVDLVLLDLLLPRMDGLDVLNDLRRSRPSLPVIILTARGSEDDRVRGLRGGADDYVIKPFSARELLARVDAVLRRSPERPEPVVAIRLGETIADCGRREIRIGEERRAVLSEMEAAILERLAAHAGRAVSREELLAAVWGIRDGAVETRAIDMHVTRLRQKLRGDENEDGPEWIATVRGKGYMLGGDVEVTTGSGTPGEVT